MSNDIFLNNLWRDLAGKREIAYNPESLSLEEIRIRNCYHDKQKEFDKLADNRQIFGVMRYGEIGEAQGNIDRASYLVMKAEEYRKTGNMECLLDLRNVSRAEWTYPTHKKAYFEALDDQQHGE